MMTRRAWPLGDDRQVSANAMITTGPCPHSYPLITGVSPELTSPRKTLPAPWPKTGRTTAGTSGRRRWETSLNTGQSRPEGAVERTGHRKIPVLLWTLGGGKA